MEHVMKKTFLSALIMMSSLLAVEQAYAGSKWVRLAWQGDASSEATISFTADGSNNNPYVSYGYSTNESNWSTQAVTFTASMASITSKHVRMANLAADSAVYFRVCDDSGCGDRFWFKTAAADNSPFVFVAGGDTRTGWSNRQDGNRLIAKTRPLFVMHGGDFTNSNNNSEWTQWLNDWELSYSSDSIDGFSYKRIYPMVSTHGNHEDGDISTICKMLGVDADRNNSCSAYDTYYDVVVSPLLRVYTLNSQFMSQSSTLQNAQNNWLESELINNGSSAVWRVAQYHKPMFPHYSGKADNQTLFNWWAQDFYDYGMNLVVESDTHLTKLTEVVAPSGSSFAGSAQGVSAGTVYVGEGSWGAPARSANDAKSWTVDLASIQQFKVISVSDTQMEVRTAQFDGSPSTLSKADRDADSTVLPTNINWWMANNVGEVLTVETDSNNRTVVAGSTGGGSGSGSGSGTTITLAASDDAFISSSNTNSNYNGSSEQLLADGSDSTYGEMHSLIKWDLSSIPSCASLELVKVQLNIFNPSSGSYNFYAGENSWDESSVTWNSVGGNAQQGNQVGNVSPGSTGVYTIQLNSSGAATVQGWIQGSANNGIVIASGGTTDGIDFNDKESGTAPSLIVTYNEDQCGGGSTNQAPSAGFNASTHDLLVDFTDSSSDSDGSIASWAWTLGDGNSSTAQNPQHTYASAGSYSVALTVTDNEGATDSYTQTLTVTEQPQQVTTTVTLTASDDTFISSTNAGSNYDGSNDELLADASDRTYGVMQTLIKWDLSSIPGCASVESAEVKLNVFNKSSGTYNLFAGVNSWNEGSATWNSVGGTAQQGSNIASFIPGSTGIYKLTLNASGVSAVQSWITGSNKGLIIASGGTRNGIDIHDVESGSGSELTVTYNDGQCGN
jgi:PKD repeat protein